MTHVADTTPYPWPWDGDLRPDRLALVVTGWDRHWPGPVDDAVLANISRLAAAVDCVLTVAHPALRRGPGSGPGTHVADAPTVPDLPGLPDHTVAVVAGGVDGFYASILGPFLRRAGRDQLLMAGLGLETTVHSTLRTANDQGLECLVVVDACAPLDPALVPRSVSMIEMSGGIFGAVGTTARVLAALESRTTPKEQP